jgi:hypothetical protein
MKLEHKRFKLAHMLHKIFKFLTKYNSDIPWKVGDKVKDDLTMTVATVVGVEWANGNVRDSKGKRHKYAGCVAIWLDNDYLDGGRHPWEISDPIPEKEIKTWQESTSKHRERLEKRLGSKP